MERNVIATIVLAVVTVCTYRAVLLTGAGVPTAVAGAILAAILSTILVVERWWRRWVFAVYVVEAIAIAGSLAVEHAVWSVAIAFVGTLTILIIWGIALVPMSEERAAMRAHREQQRIAARIAKLEARLRDERSRLALLRVPRESPTLCVVSGDAPESRSLPKS